MIRGYCSQWTQSPAEGLSRKARVEYVLPVALTMDLAERQQREYECSCCNAAVERMWSYIYRGGRMCAVYFANCYHHRDQPHDAWIDVIFGTWGVDNATDHVTFGCRVGPVVNSPDPAATLVQACSDGSVSPIHGVVLSREDALVHPRLAEFWEVVDFILANDPTVNAHLYRR